jgi:hypothetical protein
MEYCMAKTNEGFQCGAYATHFEEDTGHWHDWLWCDEHAEGRSTEEYKQAPKAAEKNLDE